jgi:Cdc6-like AAA superfamily ATPase
MADYSEAERQQIIRAIGVMAMRRQGEISAQVLKLYAHDLEQSGCSARAAVEACDRLGKAERREGETAVPEIGKLLRLCREAQRELDADYWITSAAPLLHAHKNIPSLTAEEASERTKQMRAEVDRLVAEARRANHR